MTTAPNKLFHSKYKTVF